MTLALVVLGPLAVAAGRSSTQPDLVSAVAASTAVPRPPVVVRPGDTLWSLARRASPTRDPRTVVHQLRLLNQLSDATIYVGQSIRLPDA